MIYIDLLIIQMILVFVTDLTDFKSFLYRCLSRWLTRGKIVSGEGNLKLLNCSLCQTHWAGLLYLVLSGNFSFLMWGYVCLLAFLTPVSKDLLLCVKDLLTWIISKLLKITTL